MPKVIIDGEEYVIEEMTAGEDLHITQESTLWDRVTNKPRVDVEKYTFGIVLASLKSWARKDLDGKPIPITRETVAGLPRRLFAKILNEVNRLNFQEGSANFPTFADLSFLMSRIPFSQWSDWLKDALNTESQYLSKTSSLSQEATSTPSDS